MKNNLNQILKEIIKDTDIPNILISGISTNSVNISPGQLYIAIKGSNFDGHDFISEAIQTILRREGVKNPYEQLKKLTRQNKNIQKKEIQKFIDSLKVSDAVKKELNNISPDNYTGKS